MRQHFHLRLLGTDELLTTSISTTIPEAAAPELGVSPSSTIELGVSPNARSLHHFPCPHVLKMQLQQLLAHSGITKRGHKH